MFLGGGNHEIDFAFFSGSHNHRDVGVERPRRLGPFQQQQQQRREHAQGAAFLAHGIDCGRNRSGKNAEIYGSFLLGVSHYPLGTEWSPFYSVALEMDLRSLRDNVGNTSTVPVFGPQLRGGISFFPDSNGFLSMFNAYGLVGWRAPSAFEGHAFRFGVGVSSPGVGLMLLSARLALPWMFESTFDVTEFGVRPSVRFGFSY